MQEQENDNLLLKVYGANLVALSGISFSEFKEKAMLEGKNNMKIRTENSETTLKRVENIIDMNEWVVKTNGS